MTPLMAHDEFVLFKKLVENSDRYLEFGTGGSTVIAAKSVKAEVISLDSSRDWLDAVQQACGTETTATATLTLMHIDIGPTGDWGSPIGHTHRNLWPRYHSAVWDYEPVFNVDTVLVDGRFRVACALQTFLHAAGDTIVLVHDFASRSHYHLLREFGREIARSKDLSVFVRHRAFARMRCRNALANYAFDSR